MANGWTKTPNQILEAIPDMTKSEAALTAVLLRETFGRHTPEVRLTWEDMMSMAKIGSRAGMQQAIDDVDSRGFFKRGRRSMWTVNSTLSVLFEKNYSTESVPNSSSESTENVLDYSTENVPPSIKEKKEEKESKEYTPPSPAANRNGHFPKAPKPQYEIPEPLKGEDFEKSFISWYSHLLEKGRPLTQAGGDALLRRLAKMGKERAIAAIEYSADAGWYTVHEEKANSNGHHSGNKNGKTPIVEFETVNGLY